MASVRNIILHYDVRTLISRIIETHTHTLTQNNVQTIVSILL